MRPIFAIFMLLVATSPHAEAVNTALTIFFHLYEVPSRHCDNDGFALFTLYHNASIGISPDTATDYSNSTINFNDTCFGGFALNSDSNLNGSNPHIEFAPGALQGRVPVKITIDVVHKVNKTILFSFVIVDELEANEEYTGRRRYHSMPNSENEIMFLDLSLEMHYTDPILNRKAIIIIAVILVVTVLLLLILILVLARWIYIKKKLIKSKAERFYDSITIRRKSRRGFEDSSRSTGPLISVMEDGIERKQQLVAKFGPNAQKSIRIYDVIDDGDVDAKAEDTQIYEIVDDEFRKEPPPAQGKAEEVAIVVEVVEDQAKEGSEDASKSKAKKKSDKAEAKKKSKEQKKDKKGKGKAAKTEQEAKKDVEKSQPEAVVATSPNSATSPKAATSPVRTLAKKIEEASKVEEGTSKDITKLATETPGKKGSKDVSKPATDTQGKGNSEDVSKPATDTQGKRTSKDVAALRETQGKRASKDVAKLVAETPGKRASKDVSKPAGEMQGKRASKDVAKLVAETQGKRNSKDITKLAAEAQIGKRALPPEPIGMQAKQAEAKAETKGKDKPNGSPEDVKTPPKRREPPKRPGSSPALPPTSPSSTATPTEAATGGAKKKMPPKKAASSSGGMFNRFQESLQNKMRSWGVLPEVAEPEKAAAEESDGQPERKISADTDLDGYVPVDEPFKRRKQQAAESPQKGNNYSSEREMTLYRKAADDQIQMKPNAGYSMMEFEGGQNKEISMDRNMGYGLMDFPAKDAAAASPQQSVIPAPKQSEEIPLHHNEGYEVVDYKSEKGGKGEKISMEQNLAYKVKQKKKQAGPKTGGGSEDGEYDYVFNKI